jgi:hypothetical protein
VVVGVAVIELDPVTALSIEEHLSVTFLNHPFACSSSIRPRGLYGRPCALVVGAAVSEVLE